jgi:hypothetical protein
VHLTAIQKVTSNVQCPPPHYSAQSDCLAADRQGQGDTRLTLTPSVIPHSNYVIMVSDWNCLKYDCVFLYCNHRVHRDVLICIYCLLLSAGWKCEHKAFSLKDQSQSRCTTLIAVWLTAINTMKWRHIAYSTLLMEWRNNYADFVLRHHVSMQSSICFHSL